MSSPLSSGWSTVRCGAQNRNEELTYVWAEIACVCVRFASCNEATSFIKIIKGDRRAGLVLKMLWGDHYLSVQSKFLPLPQRLHPRDLRVSPCSPHRQARSASRPWTALVSTSRICDTTWSRSARERCLSPQTGGLEATPSVGRPSPAVGDFRG